jgi:hypothetical protein
LQFQAYLKILLKTAFQKRLQNLLVFLTAAESPIPTGLKDLESLECSHKKSFLKPLVPVYTFKSPKAATTAAFGYTSGIQKHFDDCPRGFR